MLISNKSTELLSELLKNNKNVYCSGLCLSARWFVSSNVNVEGLNLIILPDRDSAEYCAADLYYLIKGDNVFFLCDSARNVQKSNIKSSAEVQRTSALSRIASYKEGETLYVITYPEAIKEKVPVKKVLITPVLKFETGEEISHSKINETLIEAGFEMVDFVSEPGQFSLRGAVVDIFSYNFNFPYRISFFGDEIEKINIFDPNTQLSVEQVESASIMSDLSESGESCNDYVFELLPKNAVLWMDSSDLYKDEEFFAQTGAFRNVYFQTPLGLKPDENQLVKFNITAPPVFNKNFEILTEDIKKKYLDGYKVYIYTAKHTQANRLREILLENEGIVPEFKEGRNIHEGFIDVEDKICCYSDHEIFERFHRVSIRRSVDKTQQLTINDLASFNIGDYVVHIDLGVGIFGGLVRIKDDKDKWHEVVKLQYKDGDVAFISVHSLHKISKFRSKDGEPPRINRMGSKTWQNLKADTKCKVKDIARELIQLYAKRKAAPGFAFSRDSYLMNELESSFEWEDTPDQEKAIKAVKKDMEDSCPMDRLICGDVGFGKTEVAIRAAYKAVLDGKQVAVLVPTTILCLQHYNTFCRRLKEFACNIDYISRLRTAKQVTEIKQKIKDGRLDIVIGTHKILSKDFEFKDLGLLIIDEEQKFGVSAKEKLREMKLAVDTLTLTATPIPRTLQFSLLGARDLSIINTPPPNRIPVQTEIIMFEKSEIKSIINYELQRGGQIFFVHNRVEELESIRSILQGLVPDMSICVAHGQMEAKELENKILDFMAGEYDMLLCTTIIENGLDIPNANTIIINQAQNIGLSDLHQLRGRVGRSKTKGFCYLIVPPLTSITDDARKRLKAIEAFSDLGSGFNIAMQDLDIRGAGNLLGAEQSGFISDMGLETYQKILAEAMEELGLDILDEEKRPQNEAFITDCTIDTDFVAFIPEDYVSVQAEKIRLYKDMDAAMDNKTMEKLKQSLEDRFGPVPDEVNSLLDIVRIRNIGRNIGFEKIIMKNGILICYFSNNPVYFKSKRFGSIIESLNAHQGLFDMKQNDNKLRLVSHNVNSSSKALRLMEILAQ